MYSITDVGTKREARNTKQGGVPAPVITLDGPGGSGKGTLSRLLAARLGWKLLDSGALYRLVALAARGEELSPESAADVDRAAEIAATLDVQFEVTGDGRGERVRLRGADVTAEVRRDDIAVLASRFAAHPPVRGALLTLQRAFRGPPGLVADGRDMGTVVFPAADLKLYLTATAGERARRRHAQLSEQGASANIDQIYRDILARDARDEDREHSPLKPASDAVVLDTTGLGVEETLDRVFALAGEYGWA